MTENEFIIDAMPIVLGILQDGKSEIIAVPEVPRSWISYNDSMDILLISIYTREFLAIEFKISETKKLKLQICDTRDKTGIKTIGIVPSKANDENIFSTENDYQIERLGDYLIDLNNENWTMLYPGNNCLIYWYAYKDYKNIDFSNAGLGWGGKKEGFSDVYSRAVKNIINDVNENGLNSTIIHHCFRGYSENSVKEFMKYEEK